MEKKGTLYIVATPIGNLEDMTFRAIRILKEVDLIACEDTRVTSKLLSHYNISKPLASLHQHSGKIKLDKIIDALSEGKNAAYCSDAGTPGISDPGNQLVSDALEKEILVVPIPGPSALATIISVAGIDMQNFVFLGFPPHKKGRETFFKKVSVMEMPVVYYDSPHRVIKNLELLEKIVQEIKNTSTSALPEKKVIIGRELTKMFEEVVRGNVAEILEYFSKNPSKIKGEFVIVIY